MSGNPLQARCRTRSLPFEWWPETDRTAWIAACRPAARLRPGGLAGHLKPVTREDHKAHYAYFLGFLNRNGLLEPDQPAAANVTPEKVSAYVAELKGRVAPTTLHGAVCKVRRMSQYVAPARDFRWLLELDKELALSAVPRSKYGRLVLTEVLVEAGLALIHEAECSEHMTKLRRAHPRSVSILPIRP
jgi:hypothetical protein